MKFRCKVTKKFEITSGLSIKSSERRAKVLFFAIKKPRSAETFLLRLSVAPQVSVLLNHDLLAVYDEQTLCGLHHPPGHPRLCRLFVDTFLDVVQAADGLQPAVIFQPPEDRVCLPHAQGDPHAHQPDLLQDRG